MQEQMQEQEVEQPVISKDTISIWWTALIAPIIVGWVTMTMQAKKNKKTGKKRTKEDCRLPAKPKRKK